MTPEELATFKRLLAIYLDVRCLTCSDAEMEDRHILTCTECGTVVGDLRTVVHAIDRNIEVRL